MSEADMEEQQTTEQPVDTVPQETTPAAPQWTDADEEHARFLGWKPQDEWQGPEPKNGFIEDPRAYVERAESFFPVRKLQETVKTLESKVQESTESVRKVEAIYQKQFERQKEQHARELENARKQRDEAFRSGDEDAYKAANEREQELLTTAPDDAPAPPQTTVEVPADVRAAIDEWRVDKDWFGKEPDKHDVEKTQQVAQLYAEAMREGFSDPKAILKRIDHKLGLNKPEPQRQQPAVEEGLALGGGQVEQFSKLPKSAKEAFRKMVSKGLFEDTKEGRAQYFEDYDNA